MRFKEIIGLVWVIGLASCVHEPVEPNPPKVSALPLYRNAAPVSEIDEPGCKPQMEIDWNWHMNYPRDSVYIRDLVVHPNNPYQWVYVESYTVNDGWELLWLADFEKREKKLLDSSFIWGYGSLTLGGSYVGYSLGYNAFLHNLKNYEIIDLGPANRISLSPKGTYAQVTTGNNINIYSTYTKEIISLWVNGEGLNSHLWYNDSIYYNLSVDYEYDIRILRKYNIIKKEVIEIFRIQNNINGIIPQCFSIKKDIVFLNRHLQLDLETKIIETFFPYCDRQYFKKIIPLIKTNEYLAIKWYKETVEPTKTLNYGYFHVFEEGGVNERRVTLNFDKLKIVE